MPLYRGRTTTPMLLSAWVLAVQATVCTCAAAGWEDHPQGMSKHAGLGEFCPLYRTNVSESWIFDVTYPEKMFRSTAGLDIGELDSGGGGPKTTESVFTTKPDGAFVSIPGALGIAWLIYFAATFLAQLFPSVIARVTHHWHCIVLVTLLVATFIDDIRRLPLQSFTIEWLNQTYPVNHVPVGGAAGLDFFTTWVSLIICSLIYMSTQCSSRHSRQGFPRAVFTTLCLPVSFIALLFGMPFTKLVRFYHSKLGYLKRVQMRYVLATQVGYFGTLSDLLADVLVLVASLLCMVARLLIFYDHLPLTPIRDHMTGADLNTLFLAAYKTLLIFLTWFFATLVSEACAWAVYRSVSKREYAVPHYWYLFFPRHYRDRVNWTNGALIPAAGVVQRWRRHCDVLFHEAYQHQGHLDDAIKSFSGGVAHLKAKVCSAWGSAFRSTKEKRMHKHTTLSFLSGYDLTGTQMIFAEELVLFLIGCSRTSDAIVLGLLARNFLMRVLSSAEMDARTLPEILKTLKDKFPSFKEILAIHEPPTAEVKTEFDQIIAAHNHSFTEGLKLATGALAHLDTNKNVINLLTVVAGVMGVASLCDGKSKPKDFSVLLDELQKQVVNFTASTKVLDALQQLASTLAACTSTGDWSQLLFPINPIQNWMEQVKDVACQVTNVAACTEQGVIKELAIKVSELDIKQRTLSPKAQAIGGVTAREFNASARTLLTTRMALDCVQSTTTLRPEPLGIIMYGEPKIGKSFFTDILHMANQSAGGYPMDDPSSCFTYTGDTAFLDGLRSNCRTLILDDVGKNNHKAVSMDPAIGIIIGAINTVPYQPNMAALEDKGSITFRPTLVAATTNVKHLNAANYVATPNAVWRRFPLVITLTVKDIYRKSGTRQIDQTKVDAAGDSAREEGLSNIWNICVEEPILHTQTEPTYRQIENFTSVRKFMVFLRARIRHQEACFNSAMQAMKRATAAPRCPGCFKELSGTACPCGESTEQEVLRGHEYYHVSAMEVRNLLTKQPEVFRSIFPGKSLDEICKYVFRSSVAELMSWAIEAKILTMDGVNMPELFEAERCPVHAVFIVDRTRVEQLWYTMLSALGVNYDYVVNYLKSVRVVLDTWVPSPDVPRPSWLSGHAFTFQQRPPPQLSPSEPEGVIEQVTAAVGDIGNAVAGAVGTIVSMTHQMARDDDDEPCAAGAGVFDYEVLSARRNMEYIARVRAATEENRRLLQTATRSGRPIAEPDDDPSEAPLWYLFSTLLGSFLFAVMSATGVTSLIMLWVAVFSAVYGTVKMCARCLRWRNIPGHGVWRNLTHNCRRLSRWVVEVQDAYVMACRAAHIAAVTAAGTLSIAAIVYIVVLFFRRNNMAPIWAATPTCARPEPLDSIVASHNQVFDDEVLPDASDQKNVWNVNGMKPRREVPTYSATSTFDDVKRIINEHVVFFEFFKDQECKSRVCAFHGVILAKDVVLTVTHDLRQAHDGGSHFVKVHTRDSALTRIQHFEFSCCMEMHGERALSLMRVATETISPLIKDWENQEKPPFGPIVGRTYNAKSDVYMPVSHQYSRDFLKSDYNVAYSGRITEYWAPARNPASLCPYSTQIITDITDTKPGSCGLPLVARDTKPFILGIHVGALELTNGKGSYRVCAISVQVSIELLKTNMHIFTLRDTVLANPHRSFGPGDQVHQAFDTRLDHLNVGNIDNTHGSNLDGNYRPHLSTFKDSGPRVADRHELSSEPNHKDPYSPKWLAKDLEGDLKITNYGTVLATEFHGQKVPVSSGLPRSEVQSTPWRGLAEEHGYTTNKVPPPFCDTMKTNGLRALNGKLHAFPPSLVQTVAGALTKWFKVQLKNKYASSVTKARENPVPDHITGVERVTLQRERGHLFDRTGPLSLDAAVNGLGQTSNLKGLNMNSSAGYPHNCKKSKLLVREGDKWKLPPRLVDELEKQRNEYATKKRVGTVFTAAMKDEPISQKKADALKGRLIFGAPLEYSIIVRQLFGAFMVHIMRNPDLYGCQVGVNPESPRWGELAEELSSFGRLFAGDYQKYDTEAFDEVTMEATYRMMIDLNLFLNSDYFNNGEGNRSGVPFTRQDFRAMWGLQSDTINPFVLYFGQMLRVAAINPSGHGLTVFLNSFGNMLLAACAYVMIQLRKEEGYSDPEASVDSFFMDRNNHPKIYMWVEQFRDRVKMITYGDDFVASSKDDDFNFNTFQATMAAAGISVTTADSAKSKDQAEDFLPMEQIDFLKRAFVYDPDLTAAYQLACLSENKTPKYERIYRAPLRKEVLSKILCLWFGKGEMDTERKIESLRAAWLAAIQQDCEEYLRVCALLSRIAARHDVPEDRLGFLDKSWTEVNISFYTRSKEVSSFFEDSEYTIPVYEDCCYD